MNPSAPTPAARFGATQALLGGHPCPPAMWKNARDAAECSEAYTAFAAWAAGKHPDTRLAVLNEIVRSGNRAFRGDHRSPHAEPSL